MGEASCRDCLAAADIALGAAGYNTVYECVSVGVPLVALALPRLYDRQQKRANTGYPVQNITEAIATIRLILDQSQRQHLSCVTSYINGAIQAVHHIANYEL